MLFLPSFWSPSWGFVFGGIPPRLWAASVFMSPPWVDPLFTKKTLIIQTSVFALFIVLPGNYHADFRPNVCSHHQLEQTRARLFVVIGHNLP